MQPSTSERPRFRQDLVAEQIDDNGARFIDVMAPDSGSVFRFYEVEFALACGMDGHRDIGGIVAWAREELGMLVVAREVTTMIATLGELGYLERDGVEIATAPTLIAPPAAAAPIAAKPAARADDELAPGIVVGGAKRPVTPVADIELGHVAAPQTVDTTLPDTIDVGLGNAGAAARPHTPPVPAVEDIGLGAPGRSDFENEAPTSSAYEGDPPTAVSMDLSEDMAVRPDDVKEAVRQSQVMRAVDVPQELLDAIEPVVGHEPSLDGPPTPVPREMVEAPRSSRPEPRPEPRVEVKPERPAPKPAPKHEARPPIAPPAPQRGINPVLLVALIAVIVGAGAFAVWRFVLQKSDETTSEAPPPAPRPAAKPTPPAPPPKESAVLASETPAAIDLKPSTAQTLESIVAKDTVKKGDVVAYFVGHTGTEKQIAALQKDIERSKKDLDDAQKKLETAQAGGNQPAITAAENQVKARKQSFDDKNKTFATRSAELEKYVLLAPADGKVVAVAKANTRVVPSDVVARIERAAMLVATFKSASSASTGATAVVKSKDGRIVSCRVIEVGDAGAKISCPTDAVKAGLEVALDHVEAAAPEPAAPKKDEEIEMGGDEGSAAAGSAKK